jgi:hypothetical protein
MNPTKNQICHLEKCSLDRAIEIAKQYKDKIWGFSIYDLLFTDGFNSVYQLKKYGKVFADLRLDSSDVDYILQCAWAAGADIVSIKTDSLLFRDNIAAYPTCQETYQYRIEGNSIIGKQTLQLISLIDLTATTSTD